MVCSEQALQTRLRKDVDAGIRTEDVISEVWAHTLEKLNTYKVDVSKIIPEQAADLIIEFIKFKG